MSILQDIGSTLLLSIIAIAVIAIGLFLLYVIFRIAGMAIARSWHEVNQQIENGGKNNGKEK